MTALYTKAELEHFLQLAAQPADGSPDAGDGPPGVTTDTYTVGHKVVSGWLLDAAGRTTWPTEYASDVPPQLFAWAVELGAIVHENPTAATTDTTDKTTISWNDRRRVEAILSRVAQWSRGTGFEDAAPAPPAPTGCFPPVDPYPYGRRW
ncbi:hypothetical protein PZ938_03110 [Luteipulveratus sp. YIM 133132]|uniref:hypothetical protein n=1 Tax=Luteipulveratus flavus TaxID=3031728 RepID=UPI0023B17B16|nr:hypothetical protein [Luteipulveratus sp. YIM 133132]MDE9364582.1 hypothetical protein [Luteipulveratus sp. YIM 133132]